MTFENTEQAFSRLEELDAKLSALGHAQSCLYNDAMTVAPKGSAEGRGRTLGVLSGMEYGLIMDPKNGDVVEYLMEHEAELDAVQKRKLELFRKVRLQLTRIPEEEYTAYTRVINEAETVWEKAKKTNDFALFLPHLEKVVEFVRRFAGYYDPEKAPYDALLNEYEEGTDMRKLDAFFGRLREDLVPLIAAVGEAEQIDDSVLKKNYPAEQQRRFTDYLMEAIGIDRRYCTVGETEHPFTNGFHSRDVRITTHYYVTDVSDSMFSVIHEGGHAMYELDIDPAYDHTCLFGGASAGIHESQSRFYENIIGRSKEFTGYIFPQMQSFFPAQLGGATAEQFWRAVNRAQPSLIRTQADELTYSLHVMVRYELEKRLIDGSLAVRDLPGEWGRLYKEYLGIDVPDDRRGCLQDSHWSGGMFGYFPSYALGNAYGAQMLSCMQRDVGDIWPGVARGDLRKVRSWLKEHIHRFGCLYKPGELFANACGAFDPTYYTDYLKTKYTELYRL